METIIKRIRIECIKYIIFSFLSFGFVLGTLFLLFYSLFNSSRTNIIKIDSDDISTTMYGDYMVVDYTVDGVDYHKIRTVSETEKAYSLDDFVYSYKEGYPGMLYVDTTESIRNGNSTIIISFAKIAIIALLAITLFYLIIFGHYVRIIKNGIIIEAEVLKRIQNRFVVKWVNPDDNKSYIYIFHTKQNKAKWEEKIEKMCLVVNKLNYKKFYVIGKEMI